MNADRLLAHYERIADAPDAIARLRRFILDLAVRGKLVPQDANDEPASELLKRIAKEKARLLKVGEIKKEKPLDPITIENRPFDLPRNWSWVRLDSLSRLITKGSSPKWQGVNYVNADEGILFITSENVGNHELRKLDELKYVESRFRDIEPRSMLRRGDILMNLVGASIGRTAIYSLDLEANINQAVALVRLVEISDRPVVRYLLQYLNSPTAIDFMLGSRVITAQPNMSLTDAREFPIPLPPLAEQHRIVAKVDELMGLCDRLEAARAGREAVRDRLAAASLARLNAPDPETFQADARFALEALPALTTRPDQIKRLRKTILNFAVRGKLVTQDANDEPAAELLARLENLRSQLIAKKVLRKNRDLPPVNGEEIDWSLPTGWTFSRLGVIFDVRDGTHDTPKYVDEGFPLITSKNLSSGSLSFDDVKLISKGDHLQISERSKVERDDILLAMIGSIGNPVIVDSDREFSIKNVALFKYLDRSQSCPNYLRYFLIYAAGEMKDLASGGLQPFVSLGFLRNYPFPLPPLAEQHRIVAKVDALMALCDRLEASLTATAATRRRLLDALLAEALAPVDGHNMEAAK